MPLAAPVRVLCMLVCGEGRGGREGGCSVRMQACNSASECGNVTRGKLMCRQSLRQHSLTFTSRTASFLPDNDRAPCKQARTSLQASTNTHLQRKVSGTGTEIVDPTIGLGASCGGLVHSGCPGHNCPGGCCADGGLATDGLHLLLELLHAD